MGPNTATRRADEILPEHRNRGFGTAVITQVIEEAAGADVRVVLEVELDNLRAQRLYERLGFIPTGMVTGDRRSMIFASRSEQQQQGSAAGHEPAVERVVELPGSRDGAVRVVAADGHSAAGKSTFASRWADRIGAAIVRGDDFYRVPGEEGRAALTAEEGAERYYDWQRLRDLVLQPLRAGSAARFRPYDWEANSLAERS